jgi:cysteine desulfurase/selenocysteine lyase
VYLDSGASSEKPQAVLDAMDEAYNTYYANVHRSVYKIAAESTERYEDARHKIATFINAPSPNTVVFGKNVTEAINLVAYTWGRANLRAGDAVVLTEMEHHANIVPWLMLQEERGIELRWLGITDDFYLDLSNLDQLLDGAKLLSFTALSNVLGTITPIRQLADAAHAAGALWAREELLNEMPPFMGGGEMILDVRKDGWTPKEIPWKFEAGTPPIVEVIGLGAAVDYLTAIGMDKVREHEIELTSYALRTLKERFGDDITIHGPENPCDRGGVLSIAFRDVHPHDISQILDTEGICVRAAHHCAKPLMRRLGVGATARASLYIYNDESDIDALADGLEHTATFFG